MRRTCQTLGRAAAATLLLAATAAWSAAAAPAPAGKALSGQRADLQHSLDDAEKQLVSLASAFPADKFSWRPGPGVRSVGEVCLHVAGGNYEFGAFWGLKPPDNLDLRKIEQQGSDKGNAVAAMRVSFAKVRESVAAMSDADLDRSIDFFGHPATVRAALIEAVAHAHEHLGQLIAYARVNGIVPPWTAAEQQHRAAPAPPPHR